MRARSWQPVIRNNWFIKFSIYDENIMLIFVHKETGETIIKSFSDEDTACKYINFIIHKEDIERTE